MEGAIQTTGVVVSSCLKKITGFLRNLSNLVVTMHLSIASPTPHLGYFCKINQSYFKVYLQLLLLLPDNFFHTRICLEWLFQLPTKHNDNAENL